MDDTHDSAQLRLGYALGILGQLFQTRVSALLAPSDLTYSQFMLLSHLRRSGGGTIGEIADAIEINQPGVTKIVGRLRARSLVSTTPDAADGRRRHIQLTEQGARALDAALAALGDDVGDWFRDWSANDLSSFAEQTERLVSWLDGHRISGPR